MVRSLVLMLACRRPDDTPVDGSPADSGAATLAPGPQFDRFCGEREWDASLVDATVEEVPGADAGALTDGYTIKGALETMKVVPPHPFWATGLRVAFAESPGTTRVRIMRSFGRSYPAGVMDDALDEEANNLTEPIEVEVPEGSGPDDWIAVDLSDRGLFLEPTQHYVLVHEYVRNRDPALAVASTPADQSSRALLFLPDDTSAYGLGPFDFRMELTGSFFCEWAEEDRWFGETTASQPFAETVASSFAVADLDGDGVQDLAAFSPPVAFRGDGIGGFQAWESDPFPEAEHASALVFADVDNDGDEDAFAVAYTTADSDHDATTVEEGDCNDTDADVEPGDDEAVDLRDNDCDGVADDGTDTTDSDGDGITIAGGDCDDTRADVHPEVGELRDSLDNDCDQATDEDYPHRILLNDGTGAFTALYGSGVEAVEPGTVSAFGDADEDGVLDLYLGNWLELYPYDPSVQDRYWEGAGDGTFVDALQASGMFLASPRSVYGVEWTDWNNDGHQDIFVGNYHLYDNLLWANQGDGTFVDMALGVGVAHDDIGSPYLAYPGGHTYGGDFGDVDNDGDMDFYMANLAHPRTQPWGDPSMFVVNQGPPDYPMENLREACGFVYDEGDVNALWADYDNDMDLDLAIASLYPRHYSRLYRNDGECAFTDVTYEAGLAVEESVSVVWVDVDRDGDDDLLLGDRYVAPYLHLFVNRVGQDNHWVNLELRGTTSNRDGIGARVSLTAGAVTQLRDIQGGGGSNTQKPKVAHFGLGSTTTVDEVTVRWVGGATETFGGVGVDGHFLLIEGEGTAQQR